MRARPAVPRGRLAATALAALIAVALAGCERGPRPVAPAPRPPLHQRIGGIGALRDLVDELAGRLAADRELAWLYRQVDYRAYKRRLLAELCAIAGGGCPTPPARARVPPAAAAHWLAALRAAARSRSLPAAARDELIRRVTPLAARLAAP